MIRWISIAVGLIAILAVTSIFLRQPETDPGDASLVRAGSDAVPPKANDRPLRVGVPALPPSLGNPFRVANNPGIFTWSAMFDGLTRIDRDGTVLPWLALSWENPEPNRWIFRLRPDVRFHDGSLMTAQDVADIANWLTSPAAAQERVATELAVLSEARALDPLTVEFITDSPDPLLPRSLPVLWVVESDAWLSQGVEAFSQQPIGTGPYRLVEFLPGRANLERFDDAWRPAQIDRLEIYSVPENAARVQGVQAGNLDMAIALGPDDVAAIRRAGGQGVSWTGASGFGVSFVLNKPSPLQDVRVRQALNFAVNKQRIVDSLLAGVGRPLGQPAPHMALGWNPDIDPYPHDPERARALLAEAGYPDGFRFMMEAVIGGGASDGAIYQQVAADLAEVGVTMEIRPFPLQQLAASSLSGEWRGEAFGTTFATEPSLDALRAVRVHSCLWPAPWYCDPAIMPTVEAALTEADPAERERLTHQIMRFYHEQAPAIFLYEVARFAGLAADLQGFAEANGFYLYDRLTFAE